MVVLILVLAALAVPAVAQGEIGYVRVASEPPGAYVYIDNVYRATTTSSGSDAPVIDVTANVQHTGRIVKSGYEDFTGTFTVKPGEITDFKTTLDPVPTPSTFGTIGVASTPGGGEVYIDGTYYGLTPTQSGSFLTQDVLPGTRTVTVRMDGFNPYTTKVTVDSGQRKDVQATLQSTQPAGAIQVTTSPSGAAVTLDGLDPQTAPHTYQNVAPGTHTLAATLDGYEPLAQSVTVQSGVTAQATLTLTQSASTVGSLHVTSTPSGADIYLDGVYRGYTPSTIGGLAPGNHNILLRLSGYQDYLSTTTTIYAGQTTELPVTLTALSSTVGSVAVVSYPAGASVYLDGSYYGQTNPYDALDISNVAPGDHLVVLSLPGYYSYATPVTVTAGATASVTATLERMPGGNQFGQLAVTSSPAGASVYVDGAYRGVTPAVLLLVRPGDRTLMLRESGYLDWTGSVSVNNGETAQVSATLQPVATPTVTPSNTSTPVVTTTTVVTTTSSTPTPTPTSSGSAAFGWLAVVVLVVVVLRSSRG